MSIERKLAEKEGVGNPVTAPNFRNSLINALKNKNSRKYSDINKRILIIECNETANFKEDIQNFKPSNKLVKDFFGVFAVYFESNSINILIYKNIII